MRRVAMVAMILSGAVLGGYLLGVVRRERTPVAAVPVIAPAAPAVTTSTGGDLKTMLGLGRKARLEPAAPPAERRRARLAAIDRGPADARTRALRMLALEDRPAADAIARRSLGDHVLFADAARLLLLRPGGAAAAADVALVRGALVAGGHDDASRAAVAALVLELLVERDSPEVPRFAARLQQDASRPVRAVGERFAGTQKVARGPAPPVDGTRSRSPLPDVSVAAASSFGVSARGPERRRWRRPGAGRAASAGPGRAGCVRARPRRS